MRFPMRIARRAGERFHIQSKPELVEFHLNIFY